jgi:hypothetical protein
MLNPVSLTPPVLSGDDHLNEIYCEFRAVSVSPNGVSGFRAVVMTIEDGERALTPSRLTALTLNL